MTTLKEQELFDEINSLPLDIKTKIVDTILKEINPINSEIDSLWIEEVHKRKREIESGEVRLVDGDVVFQKISEKFNLK